VTKEFRLDDETVIKPVLDVDLHVEHGEFIVIVGRSGTGKTTLLNLAAGLVRPTKGRVVMDSVDMAQMTDRQISSMRSQKIGFVFQFPSLLQSFTAKENVSLPIVLVNIGLAKKLGVYPKQLSAGEQKRVAIARSLVNRPQLILADEPTSDLDNRTEKEVMSILRDINAGGVTFLIVTHSLDLIAFATRAYEMENGRLKEIT
jgi:ABC-type lipoprotein export system ATPase subunit